jgi:4-hydroxythreonine-4-phosphate dehydrogenase
MTLPPLALTLGDPAGIGPEITVKAWTALHRSGPAFMVIGDYDLVSSASPSSGAKVRRVASMREAEAVFADAVPVLDIPSPVRPVSGKADPAYAAAVIRWIETAVGLALSGEASGLVTAPIAKAPLYAAGFAFPGHTEFLAELCAGASHVEPRGPVMMLTAGGLRTALVTIHEPLSRVPSLLSVESILRVGLVTARALKADFGILAPRLALAGLNPHAGEGGAIGREEIDILQPAAEAMRALGVDCEDPRPADSLFHPEARLRYDAVICLYHDQALIPVKMLDFWAGVNVTLGLPIVRTSPDHGSGFDIAGRGIARPESLIAAVRLAAEIASRRTSASA